MPTAERLFEAHLTVTDLERSIAFYRDIIGLTPALTLPERNAAFFWIGDPGESLLGLWSLGSVPVGVVSHVAFRASLEEVLEACDALRGAGVAPLSFFGTEASEPSVIAWMPAAAVYLRDPDGNQLEYLAMLDGDARPDLGIVPWSQWQHPPVVHVEAYGGPREALRALFAEAEDSATELNGYLQDGDVLVARLQGRVVGHLQLIDSADDDSSEIKNMAVEPARRGNGIGRALVDTAIERTRGRRRRTLTVATAAADTGNLRFYQRAGFRLRSVERDAFTPATGYAPDAEVDGVPLRDRVWLDLDLEVR